MARLTYAALGLAFAALVGGFFVRESVIPLIASIVLSAVVSVLILVGWTRKMRREGFGFESEEAEVGEIEEIALLEFDEEGKVEETVERKKGGRLRGKILAGISRKPATEDTIVEAPALEPLTTPLPKADEKPGRRPKAISRPKSLSGSPAVSGPKAPSEPKAVSEPKTTARRKAVAGSGSGGRSRRKVFVIPGRERYHAADCRYAKGDDLREVSEDLARRRGYTPCGLCLKK